VNIRVSREPTMLQNMNHTMVITIKQGSQHVNHGYVKSCTHYNHAHLDSSSYIEPQVLKLCYSIATAGSFFKHLHQYIEVKIRLITYVIIPVYMDKKHPPNKASTKLGEQKSMNAINYKQHYLFQNYSHRD
jgi:hypothetical protein